MVATAVSTIALTAPSRTKEFLANAALSPGHVLELMSTGKTRKNTKAARAVPRIIALEKDYDGKGITDAYAADDTVIAGIFHTGSEVALRLAASATAIVVGDILEVAADGTVRKQVGPLTVSVGTADGTVADVGASFSQTTLNNNFRDVADAVDTLTAFALALEAVDNSAGGTEVFIRALLV